MNVFDEIKNKISLYDYASKHMQLKFVNNKYSGLCPFHFEKTPSFYINNSKSLFYCFGCATGGDLFEFYTKYNKCNKKTALIELASIAGIKLTTQNQDIEKITSFFQANLKNNQEALEFIKNRNISQNSIEYFKLGLLIDFDSIAQFIKNNNLKLADYGFNESYVHMLEYRIIFPIFNQKNQVISFAGRIYNQLSKNPSKYINGYNSKHFNKSKILYGIFNNSSKIYLVEGFIDVIIMHQYNFKAFASMGTAFNLEHLQLVFEYTKHIVLAFDGDIAGQKTIEKTLILALPLLRNQNKINIVVFPEKHDPASYLSQFNELNLKEYEIFEYFIFSINFEASKEEVEKQATYYSNLLKLIPDVFYQKSCIRNFFASYYQKIKNKNNVIAINDMHKDFPFYLICFCLINFDLKYKIQNKLHLFSDNEQTILNAIASSQASENIVSILNNYNFTYIDCIDLASVYIDNAIQIFEKHQNKINNLSSDLDEAMWSKMQSEKNQEN